MAEEEPPLPPLEGDASGGDEEVPALEGDEGRDEEQAGAEAKGGDEGAAEAKTRPPRPVHSDDTAMGTRQVVPADITDEISPELTELTLIGTRGLKVTHIMGLEECVAMTSLCLRSHLLKSMAGIEALTALTSLELYDNEIKRLVVPPQISSLTNLDMSYNACRDCSSVGHLVQLQTFYCARNKLTIMDPALSNLVNLRILDLGANRMRAIENLGPLVNLEELWLGNNKISSLAGLETLTSLRKLDVQSNRLEVVTGLQACTALEELYLSHNHILAIGGLDGLVNLHTVDMSVNAITELPPPGGVLAGLTKLTDLWLNTNKIETFEQLAGLTTCPALETVYLEHNPVAADFEYRMRVAALCPSLTQIDATSCR